ncbi:hypothetical protein GLOIN_2v1814034 [Rhizophagus irregularis DAOM 181602=DAOM 197198]|nr:hypothetical protein GLOIN_2v1814034 [Rhizophagus irregularis DAOM 181602=DAOM 197198]
MSSVLIINIIFKIQIEEQPLLLVGPSQLQTQTQPQQLQTQTQTQSQPQQHQTQTQTQSQPQQHQTQTQTQAQTQSQSQSQQLQAQAQTQSQPLPYPQYNIFESSDQFIIYVEACGVARNTIEIEVNKFDAQRIYIKFNYDQDIEDGLHCLKRSFFVPKDEIKMLIQLPKSFDPDKDAKVELLCGMIKISLGKLEKLITKKFKIY